MELPDVVYVTFSRAKFTHEAEWHDWSADEVSTESENYGEGVVRVENIAAGVLSEHFVARYRLKSVGILSESGE